MSVAKEDRPLNGGELVAALPQFRGDRVEQFVVVVRLRMDPHPPEFVCALAGALTDPVWHFGHYYNNVKSAVAAMYVRGNAHGLDFDELRATASRGVILR